MLKKSWNHEPSFIMSHRLVANSCETRSSTACVWAERVGGDDGGLRTWFVIYFGRRGPWGTLTWHFIQTQSIQVQQRDLDSCMTGVSDQGS